MSAPYMIQYTVKEGLKKKSGEDNTELQARDKTQGLGGIQSWVWRIPDIIP